MNDAWWNDALHTLCLFLAGAGALAMTYALVFFHLTHLEGFIGWAGVFFLFILLGLVGE